MSTRDSRDPAFYGLNTSDRVLIHLGTPIGYLKRTFDPQKLNFNPVSLRVSENSIVNIFPEAQASFFTHLRMNLRSFGQSALYVFAAHPLEELNYLTVILLLREYYQDLLNQKILTPSLRWVDLGAPPWELLKRESTPPRIAVIHGVSEQSDGKRIELCRDFIRALEGSTVFLLLNVPNGLEFTVHKLGTKPLGILQFGRMVHKTFI